MAELLNTLKEMYIKDPTTLPTAFWKYVDWLNHPNTKILQKDDSISIIFGSVLVCRLPFDKGYDPKGDDLLSNLMFSNPQKMDERWHETKYFKLYHDHNTIQYSNLNSDFYFSEVQETDFQEVTQFINDNYEKINVSKEQVESWSKRNVFDHTLWIWIIHKSTDTKAALGIAEIDKQLGEGSLEWIQVDETYRGQGLGKALVNELLSQISKTGCFSSVAGEVDNLTNPERLYRACGFKGEQTWHFYSKSSK